MRSRPLAFWTTLLALASPRAPLKHEVAREPKASDKAHNKSAKWANFGPVIVDLGPIEQGLPRPADNRPGMNGMDFAQVLTASVPIPSPCPCPYPYPYPYHYPYPYP